MAAVASATGGTDTAVCHQAAPHHRQKERDPEDEGDDVPFEAVGDHRGRRARANEEEEEESDGGSFGMGVMM